MSRRQEIIAWVLARLQGISTGAGYQTDAGATVLVNELPEFGENDPTVALVLVVAVDEQDWVGKSFLLKLPLSVMAFVDTDRIDTADAWMKAEELVADIKKALELDDDRRMDGLLASTFERGEVETVPREPGTSTMGAIVNYKAPYKESWGGL